MKVGLRYFIISFKVFKALEFLFMCFSIYEGHPRFISIYLSILLAFSNIKTVFIKNSLKAIRL